ncbi:SNF2-related protein [Alienimonas sp. DA493]|uniref:SNF2-related protein n=1 Tax=Alienimonas sp. DA493 TaxID=3373605 RepID=UPI00375526DA
MTLAESLQKQFRADLRFRGAGYLDADRVTQLALTPDKLVAAVQEKSGEFTCDLDRTGGTLRMSCTCPQSGKLGVCKHLWGAVLLADRDKLLTGPVRGGEVPPFAAEDPASADFGSAWDFDDDDDDDFAAGPSSRSYAAPAGGLLGDEPEEEEDEASVATLKRPAAAPQEKARPWERALAGVAAEVAAPRKGSSAERQIFYELDLPASRKERRIVIQVSQRQRRASGQWGKLKALRVRPGDLDTIEREEDRTVLAYLFGGVAERDAKDGKETGVYRFHLAHELAERLLPLMCGTGNARILDAGEKAGSLTWDGDEPWELTAALREVSPQESRRESEGEEDSETGDNEESDETLESADSEREDEEKDGDVSLRLAVELTRPDAIRKAEDADLLLPGGLVLLDNALSPVIDFGAYDLAERIGQSDGIVIPKAEAHEAVEKLFRLPVLPRLELPDDQRLEEVRVEPGRELRISSGSTVGGRLPDRATGAVRFRYDGEPIAGGDPRWAIVNSEARKCLLRDLDAEAAAWDQLRDVGFRRLASKSAGGVDVEIAIGDLGQAVRSLTDAGWLIRADDKPVRQAGELKFQVKSGIDWFELRGDVTFGDATIALPDLLAALARGDDAVRLSDGSLGILPAAWAEQLGLLAGLGSEEEDHIKFSANQAVLLDTLLGAQEEVEYDEQFTALRERLRGLTGVEPAKEPEGFDGALREYQQNGLGWMRFLQDTNLGGCLADDMGLGKTVQLLALLQGRKRRAEEEGEHLPSLVVVPRSLLFNWASEAERFTPELKVVEYTGPDRHRLRDDFAGLDLILTTYGTLRRDVMDLKKQHFDYVVLDEAQTIKNASSQVSKAARLLKARHRLALSGTPIENHVGDLWSIFEFLNPGMLGRSSLFRRYAADPDDKQARDLLAKGIGPFVLRRTKAEVATDLPSKTEMTLSVELEGEQRRLYEELRDHYRQSLLGSVKEQGLGKTRMHVLEALLRLRQAACHPALLGEDSAEIQSAKVEALIPKLLELIDEGHKALVFSQFTSFLGLVRERLEQEGIRHEYLDGRTRDRGERVDRFQNDPDLGVFLISLKAGGLGLNLTSADYVFLLDPWWNPAVEAQAIDRSHRVGQERPVFAYRLIARDTIEEKIAELQRKKTELADAVLNQDESVVSGLSVEDVERLLS